VLYAAITTLIVPAELPPEPLALLLLLLLLLPPQAAIASAAATPAATPVPSLVNLTTMPPEHM
jgi:hypothetical protein